MPLLLGIDTGGTYTDAVLFHEEDGVVASAKSLTTRHDFAVGIGQSIEKVIATAKINPAEIALVSLSTTLATNALVEGQGGRVGLIMIGFDENSLDRNGLQDAVKDDPVIFLSGGHDGQGEPVADLDEKMLIKRLDQIGSEVTAFAVAGLFATRNPEHEMRVRNIILERTRTSVTCSHELSSKLDGPRRALTSVLNARLISMIHHLIEATEGLFGGLNITAPLMVVQGDGALISAEIAKIKPIETILSGPAASLVGAAYLSGLQNAVVSDIGGTTTDIAVLQDGNPRLDENGATVGGWRTMVEAVAMYTIGLGGDSEISVRQTGLELQLELGPRRLIPISLLAESYPALVHDTLDLQLNRSRYNELYGRFAVSVGREVAFKGALNILEQEMLVDLADGPRPLEKWLAKRKHHAALEKLVSTGLVMICGLTPSDAAHVLNLHTDWDRSAAEKTARLFAGNKNSKGYSIASSSQAMSEMVIDALVKKSDETLLAAALEGDPYLSPKLSETLLAGSTRADPNPFVDVKVNFKLPIIGLGASAHVYYPDIAAQLNTTALIPANAGVANAIGAVVGQVRVSVDATISKTENDYFRLYHSGEPKDFSTLEGAVADAEHILRVEAHGHAQQAGAGDVRVKFHREDNTAVIEGKEFFIESILKATAFGRPRIAR
ncbi:hydantoinase/oxoprolinase family protein [Sneathiella marina]|uniref:Hydantoinase/oxoprolinase family protein n=1 Tax=Sneathiella marina TaxID=2950108 RepID=A0ABY4VY51_9PROT|nr:hydantoinase/oxoprolinase family protein [Sneathiella marina]USG59862.1 hydantoinase/oxoprolinase family protein [Sneathiella marina]